MKKKLLEGYTIGADLIDRIAAASVAEEEAPPAAAAAAPLPAEASAPVVPPAVNGSLVAFPGTQLPPEPPPEYPLEHTKDGLFELFTIGDIQYRLGGVKALFVTSLRVNIRAGSGKKNYYDSLDLYLARSRTAFASSLERTLGAEPARVERDLVRILAFLETQRDELLVKGNRKEAQGLSAAEREAGMSLLTDPNLFERIVDDLSVLGYVGEDLNKQLLYLCATSRKREAPLSVLILSQSASGKSYLVECVKRLLPEDEVISVTSLSDQALNYLPDLQHKFLILGEAVHSEAVEHQIREMLSGKELSRLVVEKDPDSGRMESRMMKMKVTVSSVMGSTAGRVNPENSSRCFVVHADESREQTQRIHEYQRKRKSLERLLSDSQAAAKIISSHRAAQRLLRDIAVVNDFAPLLDFPATLMRSRRDHERFLDLIDCVCFLRQYQKKEESAGGVSFIRCDLADYQVAYTIMVKGVLSSTLEELPKGARLLYEQIRSWIGKEAKRKKLPLTELRFTQRQLREATGFSHTWIQTMVKLLVEYEYVEQVAGGGQRSKAHYTLKADEAILAADFSMIPSPESMCGLLKEKHKLATGHKLDTVQISPVNDDTGKTYQTGQ